MVPPKFISIEMHFVPTNIGFPDNAGSASHTTDFRHVHMRGSRGNFNWVRSSAISPTALHISGGFCQPTFLCHSLDKAIIRRIGLLSSVMRNNLHPAPAFRRIQGKIRLAQDFVKITHRFVERRLAHAHADGDGFASKLKFDL